MYLVVPAVQLLQLALDYLKEYFFYEIFMYFKKLLFITNVVHLINFIQHNF